MPQPRSPSQCCRVQCDYVVNELLAYAAIVCVLQYKNKLSLFLSVLNKHSLSFYGCGILFAFELQNTRIATKYSINSSENSFDDVAIAQTTKSLYRFQNIRNETTQNCTKRTLDSSSNWAIGLSVLSHTCVSSATSACRMAELMGFRQANSPNDLPAVRTIHVRSAFQVWTVQADLKTKLYVYGRPERENNGSSFMFGMVLCTACLFLMVPFSGGQKTEILIRLW
jgi:hypothetical protein